MCYLKLNKIRRKIKLMASVSLFIPKLLFQVLRAWLLWKGLGFLPWVPGWGRDLLRENLLLRASLGRSAQKSNCSSAAAY